MRVHRGVGSLLYWRGFRTDRACGDFIRAVHGPADPARIVVSGGGRRLSVDNPAAVARAGLLAMSVISVLPGPEIFPLVRKHLVDGIATSGPKD